MSCRLQDPDFVLISSCGSSDPTINVDPNFFLALESGQHEFVELQVGVGTSRAQDGASEKVDLIIGQKAARGILVGIADMDQNIREPRHTHQLRDKDVLKSRLVTFLAIQEAAHQAAHNAVTACRDAGVVLDFGFALRILNDPALKKTAHHRKQR